MLEETAGLSYDEWRAELAAMAQRNRARLDEARAEGAETVELEEFRREEDENGRFLGMRPATKRVPIARFATEHLDQRGYNGQPWRDKFGRVRRPWQMLERDDGSKAYGAEIHAAESSGCARRMSPRPRGAGRPAARGSSRRSSAKSGDSGSEDGEAEPPPAGRLCRCGCQASLAHYLNDTHAATDRQRRKRERDSAPSEGDVGLPSVRCGCKPKRSPLEPGWCHQCGHPRDGVPVAWVPAGPRSKQLVMRDLARRKWRTGDGKRRPLTVIEGRAA
jgi:hypothetical protein